MTSEKRMNYLAHLFLSKNSSDSMLGNFLGDFVKGDIDGRFPPEVIEGIRNHRRVDLFTDTHEIVMASKQVISPSRARYAGIIVDVVYDHFLSRNWAFYSTCSLDEFVDAAYKNLSPHTMHTMPIPPRAAFVIDKMIREDWLRSYETMDGLDGTFKRMSRRLKNTNDLSSAVEDLQAHYARLNRLFLEFFPQLIAHLKG